MILIIITIFAYWIETTFIAPFLNQSPKQRIIVQNGVIVNY